MAWIEFDLNIFKFFSILRKYFWTVRYLRSEQVLSRLFRKFKRIDVSAPRVTGVRATVVPFSALRLNKRSMYGYKVFSFLNERRIVSDWNDPQCNKLWLYNLHYFDDLNSPDSGKRRAEHIALIKQWIKENPALKGNGWEPYPMSLRIVNWVKWLLQQDEVTEQQFQSLSLQAKILSQSTEKHLFGNHLFANAKALVFAGLYFEGEHAECWLEQGLQILEREISEQILPDGGNFELTPMYHATITSDVLDLLTLFIAFRDDRCRIVENEIRARLPAMLSWLSVMCHPDGLVSFFNDSTTGVAPQLADLVVAADKLGCAPVLAFDQPFIHLPHSGYFRFNLDQGVLIGDVGKVGPDYIPGHAHADTLSFELTIFGSRLIVNGGISKYGADGERHRQRSTASHSTVEINHENSSEVWGGFRVARRAYPVGLEADSSACRIRCGHDGYHRLPGKPTHWRSFEGCGCEVVITDEIEGKFEHAVARFHLHPEVSVRRIDPGCVLLGTSLGQAMVRADASVIDIEPSFYSPEFGSRIPSQCLSVLISENAKIQTTISWWRASYA